MKGFGTRLTKRKVVLSLLSGLVILAFTWIYQNSDFSRSIEDGFFKNVSLFWKHKIFPNPKHGADFIFINTGKDLQLVEDTAEWGNITVSDRAKIYQLTQWINNAVHKPVFTVLDIQFYYPYSIDPQTDSLLAGALNKNKELVIPVVNEKGAYKKPLYDAPYASSEYRTFASGFNKFKIVSQNGLWSIPVQMDRQINGSVYKERRFVTTCNGKLCLAAVWPGYYLTNDAVMTPENVTDPKDIKGKDEVVSKISAQYYNIGEILLSLESTPANTSDLFKNKVVIIGNFQEDVHTTPVGKMSGPVLLSNIYLSLLNKQHIVSPIFLILLFIAFSALSYIAWFDKMPKVKLSEEVYPTFFVKLVRKYITYFGCMFLLSVLSVFLFYTPVALFVPAVVFAEIEGRHKTKESFFKTVAFYKAKIIAFGKYLRSLSFK